MVVRPLNDLIHPTQRLAKQWNPLIILPPVPEHLLALTRIIPLWNMGPPFLRHLPKSLLINPQALGPKRLRRLTLHLPELTLGPQRAKVSERVGILTLGTTPMLHRLVSPRSLTNLVPEQSLLPVASFGQALYLRWKVVRAPV